MLYEVITHICLGFARYAEDEMNADLQLAVLGKPLHSLEKRVIVVITVQPFEAAVMATLQAKLDQAVLPPVPRQSGEFAWKIVCNRIGPG